MVTEKLTVRTQEINEIRLTELLNATTTKSVSGTKFVKTLKVGSLEVAQTLNNLPSKSLEPSGDPIEPVEGLLFQGDINVKHLVVRSMNGFNVAAIMQNVFLNNERNVISGNLIIQNVANANQIFAKNLQDIPVNNFLTTSSEQVVKSDVFINNFHVTKLTSNFTNGEKLSENVALTNVENVIEGKNKSKLFKSSP